MTAVYITNENMPMNQRHFDDQIDQEIFDAEISEIQATRNRMSLQAKKDDKQLVYPAQQEVAWLIMNAFILGSALVATLCAPMQWGKTGVILELAFLMCTHPEYGLGRGNVFVITGMSDKEWETQTRSRLPQGWKVIHRGQVSQYKDTFAEVQNALIVIDECHIAMAMDKNPNVIPALLNEAGLLDTAELRRRNVRIFQTSATPDHVLANVEKWNDSGEALHYKCVPPLPESYISPKDIFDAKRIRDVTDLTNPENVRELKKVMLSYETPKNHIIRLPAAGKGATEKQITITHHIRELMVEEEEFTIEENFCGSAGNMDHILQEQPTKHRIILIKNKWRAAKTISDDHLGVLHESCTVNVSDSVVAQSLLGRCCGHNKKIGDQSPIVYCSIVAVTRYIDLMEKSYDYSSSQLEYASNTIKKKAGEEPKAKKSVFEPANVVGLEDVAAAAAAEAAIPPYKKVSRDAYRVYHNQSDAKAVAEALGRRYGKHKSPKTLGGFIKTSLNAASEVASLYKVIAKVPTLTGGRKTGGEAVSLCKPCYVDTNDATTLRFVIILEPGTSPETVRRIDELYPPIQID